PRTGVGRGCPARSDGVQAVDRERYGHADGVRITQPNGIFPALDRLDIPAPVMRITWLRSAGNKNVDVASSMTHRGSGHHGAGIGGEREEDSDQIGDTVIHKYPVRRLKRT